MVDLRAERRRPTSFHAGDLKNFDIPTLIGQGSEYDIVPHVASVMVSSTLVRGAFLKVYKGAPHGMRTTHKNQVSRELLEVTKG